MNRRWFYYGFDIGINVELLCNERSFNEKKYRKSWYANNKAQFYDYITSNLPGIFQDKKTYMEKIVS